MAVEYQLPEQLANQAQSNPMEGGRLSPTSSYYGLNLGGTSPLISRFVEWLKSLNLSNAPIPPMATQLLNLHKYMSSGNNSVNPDSTSNQKFTSYER